MRWRWGKVGRPQERRIQSKSPRALRCGLPSGPGGDLGEWLRTKLQRGETTGLAAPSILAVQCNNTTPGAQQTSGTKKKLSSLAWKSLHSFLLLLFLFFNLVKGFQFKLDTRQHMLTSVALQAWKFQRHEKNPFKEQHCCTPAVYKATPFWCHHLKAEADRESRQDCTAAALCIQQWLNEWVMWQVLVRSVVGGLSVSQTTPQPPHREKVSIEWPLATKQISKQIQMDLFNDPQPPHCIAQQSFCMWTVQLEKPRLWVYSLMFHTAWCTAATCFALTDPKQSRCHALTHTWYKPGWPEVPKGLSIFHPA